MVIIAGQSGAVSGVSPPLYQTAGEGHQGCLESGVFSLTTSAPDNRDEDQGCLESGVFSLAIHAPDTREGDSGQWLHNMRDGCSLF